MQWFRITEQRYGQPVEIITHRTATTQATDVLAEMVARLLAAGYPPERRWFVSQLDVFENGEWQPYV